MTKNSVLALVTALAAQLVAQASFGAQCSKDPKSMQDCLASPQLKWAYPAPQLSLEQVIQGPEDVRSLSIARTASCAYQPHAKSGLSPKFRCYRMTPDQFRRSAGHYYSKKGDVVPNAVGVGLDDTPMEEVLFDQSGRAIVDAAGKQMKGDEYKVKYYRGGIQNRSHFEGHTAIANSRESEAFTETAATRFFWVLGLPADQMVNMDKVNCYGCSAEPFGQPKYVPGATASFTDAAIEKKFPGKNLMDGWDWAAVVRNHLPRASAQTRMDFEALILGAQLISYGNDLAKQNRVMCEDGKLDKTTGVCSTPIAMINDLGSTFGGLSGSLFGQNPRGELLVYLKKVSKNSNRRVFMDTSCNVRYPLGGYRTISQAGLDAFKQRLNNLDVEKIRAIFRAAKFGRMEPAMLAHYRSEDIVIELWTQEMLARVNEIRGKQCGRN